MARHTAIYLAPLQGFSDYVYRNAHSRYFEGVERYFTPFLRLDGGVLRTKDGVDLDNSNLERGSLVPQIIANGGAEADALIRYVADRGYGVCDINFGCPFPQQTAKMRGCGILAHPDRVSEVMKATANHPDLKFSVKLRLGNTDKNEYLAIVDILNDAPLSYVTIHPRIGKQMYSGRMDMDAFADFKSRLRHPVVFNGDVCTESQIADIANKFPDLQAVMIGRGLLANPFLAENYCNDTPDRFDAARYLDFVDALMHGYLQQYGSDFMALDKMKTFWTYPLPGVDKKRVKAIAKARSLAEFMMMVAVGVNK